MKTLTSLLLALCLAAFVPLAGAAIEKGDIVDLSLGKDQNKQEVSIKDLRGKVVILLFWTTEKAKSIELLQHFEQVQRQIPEEQLRVIAVNYLQDKKLYRKMVKQFADLKSILVHDKSGRYARKFGLERAPALIMIDREGVLKSVSKSYKKEDFEKRLKLVNNLLKKKKK